MQSHVESSSDKVSNSGDVGRSLLQLYKQLCFYLRFCMFKDAFLRKLVNSFVKIFGRQGGDVLHFFSFEIHAVVQAQRLLQLEAGRLVPLHFKLTCSF